jgi:hypothetical protein
MTNELYLILHKVRGEPAFDIAQKIFIGEEECWLIPTSGHRAYPYWHNSLEPFLQECGGDLGMIPAMPEDWRDHYEVRPLQKEMRQGFSARALLEKIGLASKPIKRRSL